MLKRQLGFWDSLAINVGIIIGVGIFRVPSEVAKYLHSPSEILFAWLLGGIITLFGVLCYAELSSRVPETGGTYAFLKRAYGPLAGFMFGWMEFLILRAGSVAAVAYVLAAYWVRVWGWPEVYSRLVAVFSILFFTLFNVIGIHYGRRVQKVLTALKIISLAGISFSIFVWGHQRAETASPVFFSSGIGNFMVALVPILFTYGGWHESAYMSGEFKDTKKSLPMSIIASALTVTFLYILINAAYLKMVSPTEMIHIPAIASEIFKRMLGNSGEILMATIVIISASGALNSTVLTGARIPYALGSDHKHFGWLGQLHPVFHTPARAFWANSLWACALVCWGNFEQLLFFCAFAKWFFFALAGLSLFILRNKEQTHEGFSLFGYPFVPAIFALSSLAICATTVISAPKESLAGALLLLAGIPVYKWVLHRK